MKQNPTNSPSTSRQRDAPRRVTLLTFPGAEMLDAVGPLEVFAKASALAGEQLYEISLTSLAAGPVQMGSGLKLYADRGLCNPIAKVDTLFIGGGEGARRAAGSISVQHWLKEAASKARRIASVCTGAFVLAEGGFLDGRRAVTHWQRCDQLRRSFPNIRVEMDAIFVNDGNIYTSAGITAGIDLALALVEEDQGRELAFRSARQLVIPARRSGGQSQFSSDLLANAAGGAQFDDLRGWILKNLKQDLKVDALAERAQMSPRSFARHFARETGITPGSYVTLARLDAARRQLEQGRKPLKAIATQTGFGNEEALRRSFIKGLSLSPGEYRRRWAISN